MTKNNSEKEPDLTTYKQKILDCISIIVATETFTGQQTFELHWKDGNLVDCYETKRGKVKPDKN